MNMSISEIDFYDLKLIWTFLKLIAISEIRLEVTENDQEKVQKTSITSHHTTQH